MSLRRASELPTCENVRLQDLSETDNDDEDFQIAQDDASSSERGTAVTDGPEDKDADENEEEDQKGDDDDDEDADEEEEDEEED